MYKNVNSNIIEDGPKPEKSQISIKVEYINRSLYMNTMENYKAIRMNKLHGHVGGSVS